MIDDEIIRTEQNYFLMIHETWLYEVKCGTNGLSLSNQSNPVEILLAWSLVIRKPDVVYPGLLDELVPLLNQSAIGELPCITDDVSCWHF